jgi:hypothetical protein
MKIPFNILDFLDRCADVTELHDQILEVWVLGAGVEVACHRRRSCPGSVYTPHGRIAPADAARVATVAEQRSNGGLALRVLDYGQSSSSISA